ncbi:hypothetical protein PGTUg99_033165 [Puccinia graminis f. sp. tritici]|uniref:lytic cellulose monooxygenase (C4-dehydrogenating) n=1 Tax=Puccinia graminis f. sp. tritici TaxID=56615 RepID=A0A5B0QW98_PUCGR|nr:hypothetical protein PGTUg99_033165 [Puccinia graminis f. sp. tritici]
MYTSSSGGIPPGELDCVPARREGFLLTSWDKYPLVGRGTSRRTGVQLVGRDSFRRTSVQLVGRDSFRRAGYPLVGRNPSRREDLSQLVRRNPSRRAGLCTSSPVSNLRALCALIDGLCHGYIKAWSADEGHTWTWGQKQELEKSSIRGFSENTGWIGSKFLTKPAFVCGSGLTPSLKIVAPSGDLFSKADQSAGKTLAVASGATVRLLINDKPHKIYPHENGHIQIYLGYCGPSETACKKFDASTISYFKILSLKHGLGSKKEFPYNKHKDGNVVKVPISNNLPKAEGKQDQYYITCGQMALPEPEVSPPVSIESLESVWFPGAYKDGNINPDDPPPGPNVVNLSTSSPGGIPPGGVASLGTGYPLGYPDIRQDFRGNGTSTPESAPAGGYPLALADIRQRIADIRNRLSWTISNQNQFSLSNMIGFQLNFEKENYSC